MTVEVGSISGLDCRREQIPVLRAKLGEAMAAVTTRLAPTTEKVRVGLGFVENRDPSVPKPEPEPEPEPQQERVGPYFRLASGGNGGGGDDGLVRA